VCQSALAHSMQPGMLGRRSSQLSLAGSAGGMCDAGQSMQSWLDGAASLCSVQQAACCGCVYNGFSGMLLCNLRPPSPSCCPAAAVFVACTWLAANQPTVHKAGEGGGGGRKPLNKQACRCCVRVTS
jgi:hypothetical protein